MKEVTMKVRGMSCGHCVNTIEGNVGELGGVQQVKVNLSDKQVTVSFNEALVTLDQIKETIEDQGYETK